MHVVLADPPAFTPPYDHELASALARAGADVELLTSRFRFGERPTPDGYRLDESLYPRSSGIRRNAVRLPLKALEHPFATRRVLARPADVVHFQWLAVPELDRVLLRTGRPLVFTAHDLLPRRTAGRAGLWRTLFGRFDRVVVHSEHGRDALTAFGVAEETLRVISHPVFRSDPPRADDGRTLLALGVIRDYKGLPDAVEAVLRLPEARLLVAGDPRIPLEELRARAGTRAEWRLGYLGRPALEAALSEATVAVFPYAAELDQSGALLQALGAGIPAVAYDVAGLGEVVRRFEAGRVVAPGDVEALARAVGELLDEPAALAAAREGASRAREELTWDAAAAAHLALYEELA
jgi:glycosyltransferase involved in cell wall biosynthesis